MVRKPSNSSYEALKILLRLMTVKFVGNNLYFSIHSFISSTLTYSHSSFSLAKRGWKLYFFGASKLESTPNRVDFSGHKSSE